MSENKTGKYFKYAIGEIVLVVIGILIALQVNNWNENNKSRTIEQFYLKSLMGDMQSNLLEIEEDIADNNLVIKSCDSLLLLANSGNYNAVEDDRMRNLILSLGNYSKLRLEQGTIEEIISSGSLQILRDEQVRSYVVDWERNFIEIKEFEQFARQYQEKYLDFLDTFLPFYKFDFVEKKCPEEVRDIYFKHLELLNTIGNIRFVAQSLNSLYTEKHDEIKTFTIKLKDDIEL